MCWINNGRKKIECANYDGSDRKEVVKTGLHNPIGLVVDAMSGYYVTITVISRFLVFTVSRCFFVACLHYLKYTRNALTLIYFVTFHQKKKKPKNPNKLKWHKTFCPDQYLYYITLNEIKTCIQTNMF